MSIPKKGYNQAGNPNTFEVFNKVFNMRFNGYLSICVLSKSKDIVELRKKLKGKVGYICKTRGIFVPYPDMILCWHCSFDLYSHVMTSL